MTYLIRVKRLDDKWHQPGKLMTWDAETKRWNEPSFETRNAALAAIQAARADVYPDCVKVINAR